MDTDLQDNPKYLPGSTLKILIKGMILVIGKRVRVASKALVDFNFCCQSL